jgi:hypothetical protein
MLGLRIVSANSLTLLLRFFFIMISKNTVRNSESGLRLTPRDFFVKQTIVEFLRIIGYYFNSPARYDKWTEWSIVFLANRDRVAFCALQRPVFPVSVCRGWEPFIYY